jgi:hypothetical protein
MQQLNTRKVLNLVAMGFFLFLSAACDRVLTYQPGTSSAALSPTASAQAAVCSPRASEWSPAGVRWKLTVDFLGGSRQGQRETSSMTFLPNGALTATFPAAKPSEPDLLPPVVDGRWCATGATTFAYEFREPNMQNGHMVSYVQVSHTATMTSASAYTGDGVGVAYEAATAMPLPKQDNITRTTAVVVPS